MDYRTELREFLKSRRARLRPGDVGLHDHGRARRVAGLRREELAQLASVSIAHYTRLEQGRGDQVSDEVLDSIGAALRLDADELAYFHSIARRPRPCADSGEHAEEVPTGLRFLLESLPITPALLVGPHTQIVGWNDLAVAVFGDFPALPPEHRTLSHLLFAESGTRELYGEGWERAARDHVAHLRFLYGRYSGDVAITAHIEALRVLSADFARMWAEHPVAQLRTRSYVLHHPVVGELTLHGERISLPDRPSCYGMDLFAAEPGSVSEQALRKLGDQ
ncbi:helix-turn-helix domain-containing protein [Glycomyces buryatensis]|uniref:Helix-turn-helix transcriptional regulator n=1 Tax=Glycomyces buryatensis TaxID=2570927 RepID=A0A4S8PTF9_9ACTN|nr:helix-turn-helix transcriptional regulator [Glycomyces buryatensis]THV34687.1 helix-turn-helix transcriptional regulator [Glycomyces buryatensis]